jgi:hypothetical protein
VSVAEGDPDADPSPFCNYACLSQYIDQEGDSLCLVTGELTGRTPVPENTYNERGNQSAVNRRKTAVALLVVGLLLLPAPLYLGWAGQATAPPPKSPQVYAAEPVDMDDPTDRNELVEEHWTTVAFSAHQASERYSTGEFRSPNATRGALREAMGNGSASVADDGARADLREIAASSQFVTDAYSDIEGYYRLELRENGSVVAAEQVSEERIVEVIADTSPHYENLTAGEQRTLDRLLDTTADESAGYRPRVDEPFVDRLPTPFWKGDTLYHVYVRGHVDDFGPGFGWFVRGLVVAAVGLLLVVGSGGYLLYRQRTSS